MRLTALHYRTHMVELLRLPSFAVSTLLLPSLLFLFFGASAADTPARAGFFAASWGIYGVLGVAFFQFGVGIARRGRNPGTPICASCLPDPAHGLPPRC